ncbi:hypothetical protein KIF59_04765 [Enterobacter cloacae subsp. cloacae]|nr:hypothetical protein [Enterobacter cloacae subsp. cloacae]
MPRLWPSCAGDRTGARRYGDRPRRVCSLKRTRSANAKMRRSVCAAAGQTGAVPENRSKLIDDLGEEFRRAGYQQLIKTRFGGFFSPSPVGEGLGEGISPHQDKTTQISSSDTLQTAPYAPRR